MYGDQYKLSAVLYFVGVAVLTAKVLSWEETRKAQGKAKKISISTAVVVLAVGVFWLSLKWMQYRKQQVAEQHQPSIQSSALPAQSGAEVVTQPQQQQSSAARPVPSSGYKASEEMNRRKVLLEKLREEYILSQDNISPALLAGTEQPPADWTNKRLKEMGETWTVSGAAPKRPQSQPGALEISNRAYVGMEAIGLTKPLTVGEAIEAGVVFRNTGRTPAYDVAVATAIDVTSTPLTEIPKRPPASLPLSRSNLIPNNVARMSNRTDRTYSRADIDLIKAGKAWIYVWGWIDYRDEFGKQREGNFCAQYNPATDTSFSPCQKAVFK